MDKTFGGTGRHFERHMVQHELTQRKVIRNLKDAGIVVNESTLSRWKSNGVKNAKQVPHLERALGMKKGTIGDIFDLDEYARRATDLEVPEVSSNDPREQLTRGLDLWHQGRTLQAALFLDAALKRHPASHKPSPEEARLQLGFAFMIAKCGMLSFALDLVGALLKNVPDKQTEVQAMLALAQIYRDKGQLPEARVFASYASAQVKLLPECDELVSRAFMQEAAITVQTAEIAALQGGLDQTTRTLLSEIGKQTRDAISRNQIGDPYHATLAMVNLGALLLLLDEPASGHWSEAAASKAEKAGYVRLRALAYANLGHRHFNRNELSRAKWCFLRSEEKLPEQGHDDVRLHNCYYQWQIARLERSRQEVRLLRDALKIEARLERWTPEGALIRQHEATSANRAKEGGNV